MTTRKNNLIHYKQTLDVVVMDESPEIFPLWVSVQHLGVCAIFNTQLHNVTVLFNMENENTIGYIKD